MCLAFLEHRDTIFLAANRDEELARPSLPPEIETIGGVRMLAPRDLRAGGTWIGANDRGVFSFITNRTDSTPAERAGRSRGRV